MTAAGAPARWLGAVAEDRRRRDQVALFAILLVATLTRFAFLAMRGTWDADQGHDMLVLDGLVRAGVVPLLGPPTSIGTFHHGALYYYLLAPAAAISGSDPAAVTGFIAAAGVAAVAVTWWLARAIGGSIAGVVAGLLMAVSASAIEESTFIWNPNLIALSSAVALAATWRAWTTGRGRWWTVALAAAGVTMQCHVLGVALLPIVVAPLLVAARRLPPGAARRSLLRSGLAGVGLIALMYVPLAIHELTHDFSETRAILAFIAAGGEPARLDPFSRLVVVGLRVVAWPLTGLITDAPVAAVVVTAAVILILAWRWRAPEPERQAVRWLGGALGWSVIALALAAGGLTTVVPGLPTDHYHAFVDPIIFTLAGLGAAGLLGRRGRADQAGQPLLDAGRAVAVVGLVGAIAFSVLHWPPPIAPDGGWPAADAAAARIGRTIDGRSVALLSVPTFKSADAIAFPLVHAGRAVVPLGAASSLVVVCDRLFEPVIGATCGGPAEETMLGPLDQTLRLADRFDASPRTTVSVYVPPIAAAAATATGLRAGLP